MLPVTPTSKGIEDDIFARDIQQVDKSLFSRTGQHSTATGTTYIHMNQSATEYHTAYSYSCVCSVQYIDSVLRYFLINLLWSAL
jgi:hypothetical protein